MGVLLSLENPTAKMRTEAASAGFYESPWGRHPRLQLVPVGELLDGRKLDAPLTFKRAPKARGESGRTEEDFRVNGLTGVTGMPGPTRRGGERRSSRALPVPPTRRCASRF